MNHPDSVNRRRGAVRRLLLPALALVSIALGVYAFAPDNDNDGIPDAFEWLFGLNAAQDDALEDPDNDGLTNLEEYLQGTDPLCADTDRDGLLDSEDPDPVSRAAFPWGETRLSTGDELIYLWPPWVIAAFKDGGAWLDTPPYGWSPSAPTNSLWICLNRELLSNDLWMAVDATQADSGDLAATLCDTNLMAVMPPVPLALSSSPWFTNILPLASCPSATMIALSHAQTNGIIRMTMLYADEDTEGHDTAPAAQPDNLPTPPATPVIVPSLQIGFETSEGYVTGLLSGQNNWQASSRAKIQAAPDAPEGAQYLQLERDVVGGLESAAPSSARLEIADQPPYTKIWFSSRIRWAQNGPRLPRAELGSAAVICEDGRVVAFDGQRNDWIVAPRLYTNIEHGAWARLDIELDYYAKTYTVCVDGIATHRDIGFANPTLQKLSYMEMRNYAAEKGDHTAIDQIVVSDVEPAGLDFDGDGLDNETEALFGTDPWSSDSDGDGLSDGVEFELGLDPLQADYDYDKDGLSNFDEINRFGTDPLLADSDGNGIPDLFLAAEFTGSQANRHGNWQSDGQILSGVASTGMRLAWPVMLAQPGACFLNLDVSNATPATATFNLKLAIGDATLATNTLTLAAHETATWQIQTPWLPCGTNLVRLIWIEPSPAGKTLAVSALRLYGIDGPQTNGVQAWHIHEALESDSDGDTLTDRDEITIWRTAPTLLDSDGDGLFDHDEINIFNLNPASPDSDQDGIPDAIVADTRLGCETSTRIVPHITKNFTVTSDGALAWPDTTPACTYDLQVSTPGIHLLEIAVKNFQHDPPSAPFTFRAEVDGFNIGQLRCFGDVDYAGKAQLLTPWLPVGIHRFKITWFGSIAQGPFAQRPAITAVRLLSINGADTDGDGCQDWMKARVLAMNTDTDGDGIRDHHEIFVHGTNPLSRDSDNDGLSDYEEIFVWHTNPLLADSDGDGLDDYDEIHHTGTDPLATDFTNGWNNLLVVPGSAFDRYEGAWDTDGPHAVANQRGWVEYQIDLPSSDLCLLRLTATHTWWDPSCRATAPLENSDLLVYVNDTLINRITLHAPPGTDRQATLLLPYLPAGTQRLRVLWNAIDPRQQLIVRSLTLAMPGGEDTDGDGVRDWIFAAKSRSNRIHKLPVASPLSPVCIEGLARWSGMVTASSLTNNIAVYPATEGRWYLDLPLDPAGSATPLSLAFENGACATNVAVTWQPLDLALPVALPIPARLHDTLRVTTPGLATVTITVDDEATEVITLEAGQIADMDLNMPGTWRLNYNGTDLLGQPCVNVVELKVYAAPLPAEEPACMLGRPRIWHCPGVSPDVVFEGGSGALVKWNGTNAVITVNRMYAEHSVITRAGANGPILNSRRLNQFWIQAAVDSFIKVVEVRPTSEVWENRMVTLGVPPTVDVELRVFVGGVTFDDLTISRWLPGNTIPMAGDYAFRLIHPNGVSSSACHTIMAYQNGQLIGEAYYSLVALPTDLR